MPDEAKNDPPQTGPSYADLLADGPWSAETPLAGEDDGSPPRLLRIIEALLFIGGTPLTASRACEAIRGLTEDQFQEAIDALTQAYRRQARPYLVMPRGQGFILSLQPRYQSIADKLQGSLREARLSTAAVDVLALVAYRQPITKPEIDALRGMESGSILRQLVRRGLIQVVPRDGASARDVSYGTTPRFLELFDLQSLDDLPHTRDLQQM